MSLQQKRIKSELIKELLEYYDNIQFQIDIDAQENLSQLDKNEEIKNEENGWQIKRKNILKLNEEIIEAVKGILDSNIKNINGFQFEFEDRLSNEEEFKESLKKKLLNGHCFFIRRQNLCRRFKQNNFPLGFILLTDWYIDKNQSRYLSSIMRGNKIEWNLNSDILNLYYGIFKCDPYYYLNDLESSILKLSSQMIQSELKSIPELTLEVHSNFNQIKSNTFQYLTNLKSLTISNAFNLKEINESTFNGLSNLESLHLRNNIIKTIQPNFLRQLVNLKELCIVLNYFARNNRFTINETNLRNYINELSCLTHLKSLIINSNSFLLLKRDISFHKLEGLERLEIVVDCLTIDEDVFKSLKNLKELHISANILPAITENIVQDLKNLETFSINNKPFCSLRNRKV